MTRLPRFCRTLAVGLTAAAATLSLTQVASAAPAAPSVPKDIEVLAPNKVFLIAHATGVQIYTCTGLGTAASTPVTPDAQLVGDNGKFIAHHFGTPSGPAWQAKDGSMVVGRRDGAAPAPVPGAIDWLRVAAVSAEPGPDGDRLAGTTFIQRINTVGGLASTVASKCAKAGDQVKSPYEADYVFWKKLG
jgi:hypothetical protein